MFSYPKNRQETWEPLTSVAGSLNTGAASEATSATTRTLVGKQTPPTGWARWSYERS